MARDASLRIRLENLLLQREAAYARVHALEDEVNRILGDRYPFPPPPEPVASSSPGREKKTKARSGSTRAAPPKLRALDDGEHAYRVTFIQNNTSVEEIHVDRRSLQAMLQNDATSGTLRRIDVLDADGTVRETLYASES